MPIVTAAASIQLMMTGVPRAQALPCWDRLPVFPGTAEGYGKLFRVALFVRLAARMKDVGDDLHATAGRGYPQDGTGDRRVFSGDTPAALNAGIRADWAHGGTV